MGISKKSVLHAESKVLEIQKSINRYRGVVAPVSGFKGKESSYVDLDLNCCVIAKACFHPSGFWKRPLACMQQLSDRIARLSDGGDIYTVTRLVHGSSVEDALQQVKAAELPDCQRAG